MVSLRGRLEQYGFGKYAELFAEHGVDVDVLADLTDADLEKLGMPMGDRRFLKAAPSLAAVDASPAPAATAMPKLISPPESSSTIDTAFLLRSEVDGTDAPRLGKRSHRVDHRQQAVYFIRHVFRQPRRRHEGQPPKYAFPTLA